jgi:hypothetical protein
MKLKGSSVCSQSSPLISILTFIIPANILVSHLRFILILSSHLRLRFEVGSPYQVLHPKFSMHFFSRYRVDLTY